MSTRTRKIVEIDQEKCNGCGACLIACHEGAIEMVNGKARLVGDEYCDGLGDCLPECPTGAITIIVREAASFSVESVNRRKTELAEIEEMGQANVDLLWPLQLQLLPDRTARFEHRHLVIAADCTAFVFKSFHEKLGESPLTIFCPKLDEFDYKGKLVGIFRGGAPKAVTVLRMEVACCGGLARAVKSALREARLDVPYYETVLSTDGEIID